MVETIWKDRKRTIFGLPWSFTTYSLDKEKLTIETGIINLRLDEVRLYRILDISVERNLFQRMFGLGSIVCNSNDKSLGNFIIKNIKDPVNINRTLSDLIETERTAKRVTNRELVFGDEDDSSIEYL